MAKGKHPFYSAILALTALSLVWGYNWVVMKEVLKYSGPFEFSALRTLLGALSLFIVLIILRKPLRPTEIPLTLLLGLLQTSAFTGLVMMALVNGGAGKTAVLVYTMPFWVLILAWPILHEYIKGLQWVAVLLAFFGLLLIVTPWKLHSSLLANMLAIIAGLTWAGGAIVAKILRARVKVDLLSLTAWQMLFGALALVGVALGIPEKPIVWSGYFIAALIYNAVLGTALCWLLWLYILHRFSAGVASMSTLAIPIVGVLSAWLELGEKPSSTELLGISLIVGALGLLSVKSKRSSLPQGPE